MDLVSIESDEPWEPLDEESQDAIDDSQIAYLMTQLPQKEPAPRGDLTLQVGSGARGLKSIRVSSQVLSIASPVFAQMFISGFHESAVSSSTPDQPFVFPLPEDDPDAVWLMCHVFHPSGVGDLDVPRRLLESLALLSDKYDCAVALTPWSRMWFEQNINDFSCASRPWDRLCVAYALGTEEAFWEISKNLISNYWSLDDEESKQSRFTRLCDRDA